MRIYNSKAILQKFFFTLAPNSPLLLLLAWVLMHLHSALTTSKTTSKPFTAFFNASPPGPVWLASCGIVWDHGASSLVLPNNKASQFSVEWISSPRTVCVSRISPSRRTFDNCNTLAGTRRSGTRRSARRKGFPQISERARGVSGATRPGSGMRGLRERLGHLEAWGSRKGPKHGQCGRADLERTRSSPQLKFAVELA